MKTQLFLNNLLFFICILTLKTSAEPADKLLLDKNPPEKAIAKITKEIESQNIFYLCKDTSQSVRTLRMEKQKSGACVTSYSKQGVDKPQIKSWKDSDCIEVMQNIRNNLEKGNWKCKEVSGLRISGG